MKKFSSLALMIITLYGSSFAQLSPVQINDGLVLRAENNPKTATLSSVLFTEETQYKEQDAAVIFSKYLPVRIGSDELKYKTRDAANNISVTKYTQFYKGIKVEHGSYAVTAKNDKVSYISGEFYKVNALSPTIPGLTEANALSNALAHVGASVYKWEIAVEETYLKNENNDPAATYYPKGELVFVEDFTTGELTGKVMLAYKFNIYAHQPLSRAYIYVDAATGKILLSDAIIKHLDDDNHAKEKQQKIEKYFAKDLKTVSVAPLATGTADSKYSGRVSLPTKLVGGSYQLLAALATEGYPLETRNNNTGTSYAASTPFTDVNNDWTAAEFDNATFDNVALDAHWGAAKVYDYWKIRHGRLSYDNANAVIKSYVHHNVNLNNAFWNGSVMTYGDGTRVAPGFLPVTSLDVCAHEVGHAVCSSTANLTYSKESGGMNEGFSDIWGAAVEQFADPGETDIVPKNYFDIGEEIGLPLPTPLRSMSNPKAFGQPDTYLGTYWVSTTTPTDVGGDNWGVHTNSGVLNKWFYLLVSGGAGTNDNGSSYGVPAIGWVDAERIAYLTELNLAPNATYATCRTAAIAAATSIFGSACTLQVEAVTRAFYAVGVGADFVPCTPQISFAGNATIISETRTAGTDCATATKTLSIPLKISQAATGGTADPVANVIVTGGTAVSGIDYTIASGSVTFPRGNAANQNLIITIKDDGNIEADQTITLELQSVTVNGTNASKANILLTHTVTITNDDKAEDTGGNENHTMGVNAATLTQNNTSPFHSIHKMARTQYILSAADLIAAGVRPNVPITSLAVDVVTKLSTVPFTDYTLSMGNTTATDVSTSWVAGLTTFYFGNYTTQAGTNTFPLSTAFTWNGTGNVAIQVCFKNGSAGAGNDATPGYTGSLGNSTNWVEPNNNPCNAAFNAANSPYIPIYTFTQLVSPSAIETTLSNTRQWTVDKTGAASTNMFYSTATGGLIAKIKNNSAALGCVTATVTGAGTTFPALGASFPGRNRSAKQVTITPTTNGATATYNATIYLTTAELAGKAANTLQLVKTNAATDAQMTSANTAVVTTPTLTVGTNFTGFSGNFTGFSRFFLIDGNLVLPSTPYTFTGTGNWNLASNWLNNTMPPANLSSGEIIINHQVPGTCVLNITQTISGTGILTVNSGRNLLVPGSLIRN